MMLEQLLASEDALMKQLLTVNQDEQRQKLEQELVTCEDQASQSHAHSE